MKKVDILFVIPILAIFGINNQVLAATVGNPLDLDIPPRSAILRQQVIENTLDEYEQIVKIKAAVDLEFIFDKDLHTSIEMEKAELKGQYFMLKLGTTIFNRVEPYIKIGTSNLEVKWRQGGEEIEIEADYGFAWGGGVKGIIWEFEDWGIRLTGDAQYRITEPDVGNITRGGAAVNDTGADFNIREWQASLILSKKFELPLRWQNVYIVPYAGINISDSTVDVAFKDPNVPTADFSLFDANNDDIHGFLIGCDIMPSLTSTFIYSIELRLVNELALTFGGTMKF